MPGGQGGSDGGGSNGFSKLAALLLGGGLLGILTIFGPRLGGDDSAPPPGPTRPPQDIPTVSGGNTAPPPPTSVPEPTKATTGEMGSPDDDLRGDPGNVILTITVYGLPGRVGAELVDKGQEMRQRQAKACVADLYPEPCITYYIVKPGTSLRITGGDARAGMWPVLEYFRGAGCNVEGPVSKDFSCQVVITSDTNAEARYYGDTTPSGRYSYPKCAKPGDRGNVLSAWMERCQ